MSRARVAVGLALGLAAVRPAAANVAAPPPPAEVAGLASAGATTPLAVRSADLAIDCSSGEACQLEVRYVLANPSDAAAGGTAAFYALDTADVTVEVDGAPADRPLADADVAGYDAAVARARGVEASEAMANTPDALTRHGFDVTLAPGATAAVTVRGTIAPQVWRSYSGMVLPPDRARHLLLTPDEPRATHVRVDYLVTPIRTWAAWPAEMGFTLRRPARWAAYVDGATGLAERRDGAVAVTEGRIPTATDTLAIDMQVAAPRRLRGGVFFGVGGMVDDATGVRLRAGAEVSWRRSRLLSLAVEYEGGDAPGVVVVPAVAVATPMILIIPSLSAGFGVPLRLRPDVEVGIRFQLDAMLGPVGLLCAYDIYPKLRADPRRFEASLMFQLAL